MNIYDQDLDTNAANFTPLSPISMMRRVASIYPDKTAVVYGCLLYTSPSPRDRQKSRMPSSA